MNMYQLIKESYDEDTVTCLGCGKELDPANCYVSSEDVPDPEVYCWDCAERMGLTESNDNSTSSVYDIANRMSDLASKYNVQGKIESINFEFDNASLKELSRETYMEFMKELSDIQKSGNVTSMAGGVYIIEN